MKLCIFRGESPLVKHKIYLGKLEVPVPPRRAGEVRIEARSSSTRFDRAADVRALHLGDLAG